MPENNIIEILKTDSMKKFIITCCTIILIFSCSTQKAQFAGEPFEKHETLEGTGFTQQKLDSLTNYIKNNLKTTGMLILKDGKILYEYGDIEEVSYISSCRKSVLSILYGKYVENGTIDLNQTIGDIGIDEDKGLLDIEKTATIDHILTARSGVFYEPANAGYDKDDILERGSVKPGEYFVYNNWDFNVAGSILEIKTGKSVYREIEEQLAIPLGFQDWNIKNQKEKYKKSKSRYPAHHMYLSTRDMAKIGQLMLNEGEWDGEQIVSKDWIKKITTTVTPTKIVNKRYGLNESSPYQFSYAYMWWIADNFKQHPDFEGAYTAHGYGGKFITIIPKLNLVVAHTVKLPIIVKWGFKEGGVTNPEFWKLLYDNVGSPKNDISVLKTKGKTIKEIVGFIENEDIQSSKYDISESGINSFGYQLMAQEKYDDALKIFKLNTKLYPNRFNTFDSYGECLMKSGLKIEAIKAYEKSLELNAENERAKENIIKLKSDSY